MSGANFTCRPRTPMSFPRCLPSTEQKYHQVSARFFRELVRRTIFATDNESSRYALGGVLVELAADGIIGVGTDGRRLARQQGPAKAVGGHADRRATIVPARAINYRAGPRRQRREHPDRRPRKRRARAERAGRDLLAGWWRAVIPKWRNVFPRDGEWPAWSSTVGPFYSAVHQAAIVTSEERRGVDFRFADGKLVLAGHGAEAGESHIELPIAYEGQEIGVKLDPRYVERFPQGARSRQDVHPPPPRLGKCGGLQHRRRLCLRDHALVPEIVIPLSYLPNLLSYRH